MTTQSVTKTYILGDLHGTLDTLAGWILTYANAFGNGDVGAGIAIPGAADKSIQVTGTFGAGGSVALEGSNDGVNFYPLTDPTGTIIAITAAQIKAATEATYYVRPHVTAGDGSTALTITIFCRNTQVKF